MIEKDKRAQGNIRAASNIRAVSREVTQALGRGSETASMATTVITALKEIEPVKHLRYITNDLVNTYVSTLQEKVANGDLTRKTTSTYITALNNVINHTNSYIKHDHTLDTIKAKDHGLSEGQKKPILPSASADTHNKYISELAEKYKQTGDLSFQAEKHSVTLQREFALRNRESRAIKITEKEIKIGDTLKLTSKDGTKNSRGREFAVTKQSQVAAFNNAKQFALENGWYSLCPPNKTLKQQMSFGYRTKAKFEKKYNVKYNYHDERRTCAQNQHKESIKEGLNDKDARLKLAQNLGHNRIDVTYRYVPK